MGRMSFEGYDPCVGKFEDECWMVSSNRGDDARVCWDLRVDMPTQDNRGERNDCWSVSGKDLCVQGVPTFDNDIDLEKNGVFKVFAVHIKHEFIYMAVEMREPDDPTTETYIDEWGSATNKESDIIPAIPPSPENPEGTPEVPARWVYYPPYVATEIVDVYDVFGTIPHTVETEPNGRMIIVLPNEDINFNVKYKMNKGLRLIKGIFASEWASGTHYMLSIEKSVEYTDSIVGEGCFLMNYEEDGLDDPLVFKSKDGSMFLVDVDTLQIGSLVNGEWQDALALGTTGINFMLNKEYALKPDSTSRFNVYTNSGEPDAYPVSSDKLASMMQIASFNNIMQNDDITIGFVNYTKEQDISRIKLYIELKYWWFDEASSSSWAGVGSTGNVVGIEPYNPDKYYLSNIPYIPNPIPPTPYLGDSELVGMSPYQYHSIGGDYLLNFGDFPKEDRVRISTRKDFLAVMSGIAEDVENGIPAYQGQLVWFKNMGKSISSTLIPTFELWSLYPSDTVLDFCVYDYNVMIADGTKILKVRNIF